jgi:hypothetical protein
MAHRTCGFNEILVPRVNCRSTRRFLAMLSAKFPLNLCSILVSSFLITKTHNEYAVHLWKYLYWFQLRELLRWYWVLQYHVNQNYNVLLHYDRSKRCVCPVYKFIYSFKVVKLFCNTLYNTLNLFLGKELKNYSIPSTCIFLYISACIYFLPW